MQVLKKKPLLYGASYKCGVRKVNSSGDYTWKKTGKPSRLYPCLGSGHEWPPIPLRAAASQTLHSMQDPYITFSMQDSSMNEQHGACMALIRKSALLVWILTLISDLFCSCQVRAFEAFAKEDCYFSGWFYRTSDTYNRKKLKFRNARHFKKVFPQ